MSKQNKKSNKSLKKSQSSDVISHESSSRAAQKIRKAKKNQSRLDEQDEQDKPIVQSHWQYTLMFAVILMSAAALSYQALNVQVINIEHAQNEGDERHKRTVELAAHRGKILDRNNELLAISSPVAAVGANPKKIDLNNEHIPFVANALDMSVQDIVDAVNKKSGKSFVYFKRQLNPAIANEIKAKKIPGIFIRREFRRYYPAADVTGHIVGLTNTDEKGIAGIEKQFNETLTGVPGREQVVRDLMGHVVESVDLLKLPRPGSDIQLSLDKRLQYIAYRELKKAVTNNKATSGSLVILDVTSGEVLALVNEPTFNPNKTRLINDMNFDIQRNRAVVNMFEPGSTIKPFIVAAALKTKQFSPTTPVNTSPGYMRVGRRTIRDVHDYGQLDISGIIQKSSNVGISKIALALPKEMLWESLSDMGFGELTNSEFPGEVNGVLPFFGEWKKITQATVSYGYGISVTALQLAQSYALLANGGYLKPVSFIKLDVAPEGRQVIESSIADAVMKMMESVVSREGTAIRAKIQGYRVAGKTGTMKKVKEHGGYFDDRYLAVFAGVVPASQPRFAAVVLIDDPQAGDYYGGKVAAPVFSKVMAEALRLMNVAPDDLPETENVHIASIGGG